MEAEPNTLFHTEIPASDVSGKMLSNLFGRDWNSLIQAVKDGEELTGAASLILSMLQAMSTIALSIGAVIMVYTIFVGVLGTAWSGRWGGKMSMWTPIRSALAVGMLIPTAKGLNTLMVLILMCISGSVSFANYLTDRSYDFMQSSGGQIAVSAPPAMRANIEEVAQQSIKTLAGQHFMAYKGGQKFSQGMWSVFPPSGEGNHYTVSFNPPDQASLDNGDMGSIRIPCYKDGGDDICRARTNAIQQMLRDLVPEARNMAVSVMTEKEIQAAGAPSPRSVDGGAILDATDNYVSTITPYISQIIKDADPEFQESINNFIDTSRKDGWFMLGSYYWTIARITEHTHELAGNLPTTTQANISALMSNMWEDPAFAALWQTSEDASEKALNERRDAAKAGTEGVWAKVVEFVKQNLFPDALSPVQIYTDRLKNENALMTLTDMGHSLVSASEALGIAAVGAGAAAAAAEEGSKNIVLNTLTLGASSAAGGAAGFISKTALVIVSIIISALFSAGVLLAFYLPALPWILWMSALIGWLILIVETLFAAPLWAVGHLIPEGDGFAGQHGRQGYMLFLGVLARPPLMVAGFFTSLIIFSVFGNFVGYCFSIFHASVSAGHAVGVVSTIVQIIILTSAILVFSHKIFSLMNILPERVCNWVGQLNQSLGEESDPAQVRGAVVAGGGVISKGGGAAAPAPQRGGGGPEPEQLKPSNTGGHGSIQNGDLSQ